MAYDLGDVVQLTVTVIDASDDPADAGNMTLTIGLPDDTTVTVDPVASDTPGVYVHGYATVQAGRHTVRWLATGANAMAHTDVFDVREQLPVAIVSLARAKTQLEIPASDTSKDEELRGFVSGATLAVERHLGFIVARRTFTERCTPDRYGDVLLSNVPVVSLVTVQTPDASQSWDTDDLQADPATGQVEVLAGPALRAGVDFTYRAGLAIVPEDYQLATLIIIEHLWETKRGAMGVSLGGDNEPWMPGRGFAIPRRALELLDSNLPGVA
ncbi:hypothetical protein OG352_05210 [Streptomyces sp. NBC_01485]|uniref:hypothetical protein n=1 Tax=Streptomyces sp. NBC_01485 TaxID=2903884 RepID=UPI002E3639C1|nr:hypothetical protein [Streptomyces sp. NBC_01485]